MPDTQTADEDLLVHLPNGGGGGNTPDQDAEWCEVQTAGQRLRLRLHDYADIYSIPGLYERLFYEELECSSPVTVRGMLEQVLEEKGRPAEDLVVLDVGAGNGLVAEELADLGAAAIVGVDILPEAAAAAERDRPGIYEDYRVIDLTDPPSDDHQALAEAGFNCMTSVAALGFGDIPPEAFAQAVDYVDDGGLIAFTIKERFVTPQADETGFSTLIRSLHEHEVMETLAERRYRHRLSVHGDPLHYVAYVAEKRPSDVEPLALSAEIG